MSKRSKEKKPALADWAFGAVGQRRQAPPIREAALSFRKDSLVFTAADGRLLAVVALAPGMFVERVEPLPADPPLPGDAAERALAAEAARTELAAKRQNGERG